jgi:hypothetical protein
VKQGVSRNLGRMPRDDGAAALFCALLTFTPLTMPGCTTGTGTYYEKHEIQKLTVVFLDEKSLRGKWALVTRKAPFIVSPSSANEPASVSAINGFFDFSTNTLYCPKMDFEVCGHELHHAVLGRFHREPW